MKKKKKKGKPSENMFAILICIKILFILCGLI